jgi:hypothetical protein
VQSIVSCGVVVHPCNSSIWKAKVGELEDQSQLGQFSKTLSQNKQEKKKPTNNIF